MKRGRHLHGAVDRQGILGRIVSSVRAKFGQGGAHSWRPKHVRTEDGRIRRLRSPIVLFVCAFIFASGTAAFAYTTAPGSGTGHAQAIALNSPGVGTASNPTTTSLSYCARGLSRRRLLLLSPSSVLVRRVSRAVGPRLEWSARQEPLRNVVLTLGVAPR